VVFSGKDWDVVAKMVGGSSKTMDEEDCWFGWVAHFEVVDGMFCIALLFILIGVAIYQTLVFGIVMSPPRPGRISSW